jgi:endoglucanase
MRGSYLNPRLEPFYRDVVAAIRSVDPNHLVFLAGAQWSTSFEVFGRPFDANSVYTYHKFWANPTRDSLQSYLDFSNRWNVPLLIGETGELTNAWNEKFRLLHEQFGIGWCFWPYKNLDSDSAVVSIAKPAKWDLIARAGSANTREFKPGTLPPASRHKESSTPIWKPSSSAAAASTEAISAPSASSRPSRQRASRYRLVAWPDAAAFRGRTLAE